MRTDDLLQTSHHAFGTRPGKQSGDALVPSYQPLGTDQIVLPKV